MTVLGVAKVPFFNRDTLAAMLSLSPGTVDLIENDVGGGFGARGEFYPEDFLIPFTSAPPERPRAAICLVLAPSFVSFFCGGVRARARCSQASRLLDGEQLAYTVSIP
jgi:hypothetical protein